MQNYLIVTDSACDIAPEVLEQWGVKYCALSFRFEGNEKNYSNYDIASKEFYQMMRDGAVAKTSAANSEDFKEVFEPILKEGFDILYLGFSSGLSTTCHSAKLAADDLKETYPDRTVITIDTLAASAGFGLLLSLAVKKKNEGADIKEVADYTESLIPKLCHWFTVDDLVYLKRGGRVSPTVAFVGGLLGIKPILHVDDEGHLISKSKVRGRKAAIAALADKFGELAEDTTSGPVFVCHADCIHDVNALEEIMKDRYGVGIEYIADVGPVIGAHSGPGTLAIFFIGKNR